MRRHNKLHTVNMVHMLPIPACTNMRVYTGITRVRCGSSDSEKGSQFKFQAIAQKSLIEQQAAWSETLSASFSNRNLNGSVWRAKS